MIVLLPGDLLIYKKKYGTLLETSEVVISCEPEMSETFLKIYAPERIPRQFYTTAARLALSKSHEMIVMRNGEILRDDLNPLFFFSSFQSAEA